MQNVDENEVKRNELYATINTITLAPEEELNSYDTEDVNFTSFTTTSSSNSLGGGSFSFNGLIGKSSLKSSASSASSALHCPVRFDGYLCWPRTPAGTVLSQYCPDFVEGFNSKFLAHKT